MIRLFHSPNTRSTSILSLLHLMGKRDEVAVQLVHIKRSGGLGHADPENPHPEGKVPLLEVDGRYIRERGAIILWLTDHFDSPLGRGPENPARAEYLSWLFYYGNVVEPVLYLSYFGQTDTPIIFDWCRDLPTLHDTLEKALSQHAFLVDDRFSAVDLLISAPFKWLPDMLPEKGVVRDWFDTCMAAQDTAFLADHEAQALHTLGLPAQSTPD